MYRPKRKAAEDADQRIKACGIFERQRCTKPKFDSYEVSTDGHYLIKD